MGRILRVLLLTSACAAVATRGTRAEGEPPPASPGFAGKPVEWWIEELGAERTREVAETALRTIGQPAAPALVRALSNERVSVRRGAAVALTRLSWPGDEAVPMLGAALSDAWPEVRAAALRVLMNVPSGQGRSLTPRVVPLLRDDDVGVRRGAARFVARYPIDDPETIGRLIAGLRDGDPEVRESIAEALAGLGPKAEPAVDALLVPARDPKVSVRQTVLVALARSGSRRTEVLQVFLDAAKDPNVQVRVSAHEGLRALAPTSDEALRVLGAALDAEDRNEARSALLALARVGPRATGFLPRLVALLRDESPGVADAALDAICALGEGAAPALPVLVRAGAAGKGAVAGILHQLAATHVLELLEAIEGDPSRRDVVLKALEGARPGTLATVGPQVMEALAPILVDPSVTRPARAAAVQLLRRVAGACPTCREAATRAAQAFLATATPSPADLLGEAWILVDGSPFDRWRDMGPDGDEGPDGLRWTLDVLAGTIGDPTVSLDRRREALRLLARLARQRRGDADTLLAGFASAPDPEIAAAAKGALDRLARERRR